MFSLQKTQIEVEYLEMQVQNGLAEEKDLLTAQNKLLTVIEYQEIFLMQKASLNIFTDGDRNTKFCRAYIKNKRKCNTIHSIQSTKGIWLKDNESIARDVFCYYQQLLKHTEDYKTPIDRTYFNAERSYTMALKLTDPPTEQEIWLDINSIDSSKSAGLDGFTVDFYKKSWDFIKKDVTDGIKGFFQCNNLPQYISEFNFI
ncbi:uncharacterized protein LOC110038792 [Phalaenopsis equestris]|uniref:uncharacterized protein LOC110038792 n=1 Tax=Phalaenopsis equestris TaxID=78828 RepID=UPI0009E2E3D2|nr:uncharacterized protein LOC110038792 [Phalaenopsis equestris]